jgi:hypothetical protein
MSLKLNKVYMVKNDGDDGKDIGKKKIYNLDESEWRTKCVYSDSEERVFFPIYQQEKLLVLDIVLGYGIASKHVVENVIKFRPFVAPVRANKIMPEACNGVPHVFYTNADGETCWLVQEIIRDVDPRLSMNEKDVSFLNMQTFDLRANNIYFIVDTTGGDGELLRTSFPLRSYATLLRTGREKTSDCFVEELKRNPDGKVAFKIAKDSAFGPCTELQKDFINEFVLRAETKAKAIFQVSSDKKKRKRKRPMQGVTPDGVPKTTMAHHSDSGLSCGAGARKVCRGVTKVPGIFYHPKNKFTAEISVKSSSKHIGVFDTLLDALNAKADAEKEHYGETTWVTQSQILDMLRTLDVVYTWELHRENFKCGKCMGLLQIHGINELASVAVGKTPTYLPEEAYAEIMAARFKDLAAVVRKDSDYVLCPCGWIVSRISELFHFGIDSAHIQNKFRPAEQQLLLDDVPEQTAEMIVDDLLISSSGDNDGGDHPLFDPAHCGGTSFEHFNLDVEGLFDGLETDS